jgi:hypothetical protein
MWDSGRRKRDRSSIGGVGERGRGKMDGGVKGKGKRLGKERANGWERRKVEGEEVDVEGEERKEREGRMGEGVGKE